MADERSRPLGVVINPNAGFVRRRPAVIREIAAELPEACLAVPESGEAVRGELETLCRAGADPVAIIGGDGTVTGTLTPLIEVWKEGGRKLPRVALMPGGSVSTIPRALGGGGAPDRKLRRLARNDVPFRSRRLNVVEVRAAGRPVRYGMIFGNGAVSRWLEEYYRPGSRGRAAAVRTVVRSAASMMTHGSMARRMFRPYEARLTIDGRVVDAQGITALAAGGVREIGLGFRPFHAAGRAPGRIHWIQGSVGPWHMIYELSRVGLRLPRALSVVQHLEVACVEIELSEPRTYTIDAELYPQTDRIEVLAGPMIDFVAV